MLTKEDFGKPCIEGLSWAPISQRWGEWLGRPFEDEEIRLVVFSMVRDKAPSLFQDCWEVIKGDLLRVFP